MLDLFAGPGLGESHVKCNPGDNRLPGLVFGKAAALDRTPEIDNFFLGNTVEKVLVAFFVQRRDRVYGYHVGFLLTAFSF